MKIILAYVLLMNGIASCMEQCYGDTALHIALRNQADTASVLQLLRDNPTAVGMANVLSQTPLHLACASGNLPVIAAILESVNDRVAQKEVIGSTRFARKVAAYVNAPDYTNLSCDPF